MKKCIFPAGFAVVAVLLACGSFDPSSAPPNGGDAGAAGADGGGDGGSNAPTPKRCTGPNIRIDDSFSAMSPSGSGWSRTAESKVRMDDVGLPAPSIYAETRALSATETEDNVISRTVSFAGDKTICIELDVFLEKADAIAFEPEAYAEVLQVSMADQQVVPNIFLEQRPEGFAITHDGKHLPLTKFEYGKWQHLTVLAPFGSTGEMSFTLGDGVEVVNVPGPIAPAPAGADFDLGLAANARGGKTGALRVRIDNFRLVTTP